ncbi:hypothetical protein D6D17_00756 [Aureobasidium pullulans]|uniref:Uncharacterized protein n=1 Tax=Aureobasidium pullulans TaxID=5580 RepID=A0A4T0CKK6_AURPU|nr:hypothetical protein D6D22_08531 [Aureobasidium pullulans]THX20285.1 hypothetical protein D6D17_00756 [Aureobasidium pullulans]TIA48530.1 hypothetical protein D6C83_05010 [Aureobasidium pullulans]TIA81586.1 hypothetical protein D6C76_02742 [Aureobasidium pullulans]
MNSNRPFFSNFWATFRAHSAALPKSSSSISAASPAAAAVGSSQTVWSSTSTNPSQPSPNAASAPRTINSKSVSHHPSQTTAAPAQPTPLHPALSPLQHNVSPLTHGPRSPPSPALGVNAGGMPVYGPPNRPPPSYPTASEARRNRRGSDSSSESGMGYRDVLGAEKWYIGGRTAAGEERFYKLSMVRRDTSADRLSADRLSL